MSVLRLNPSLNFEGTTLMPAVYLMGKQLCCYVSCLGSIPLGGHTSRSCTLLARPAQLSILFKVSKQVLVNIGANSGSSLMRVGPIGHHWWYD